MKKLTIFYCSFSRKQKKKLSEFSSLSSGLHPVVRPVVFEEQKIRILSPIMIYYLRLVGLLSLQAFRESQIPTKSVLDDAYNVVSYCRNACHDKLAPRLS